MYDKVVCKIIHFRLADLKSSSEEGFNDHKFS